MLVDCWASVAKSGLTLNGHWVNVCVRTTEWLGWTASHGAVQHFAIISLRADILVQVTIYRRLRIGQDGNPDQSEAYDIS